MSEDWDPLVSEMVRQNCVFVASCSVIIWDLLISFGEEVRYVWHCPSKITKYLFLFCRYWTVGYSIAYLSSGTQWTPQIPIHQKDCRTWFLIHTASVGLLYTGSQLTLIQKVFALYGRSVRLAIGLFTLQCLQVTGIFLLSHHISASLHFNAICNAVDIPNLTFSVLAMASFVQCIIWVLILRKVWRPQTGMLLKWRRHLVWTSDAHAKLSWGVAFAAIAFNTTRSFARQRIAPVYLFTVPVVVLSVGTCRYILRIEKARVKHAENTEIDDVDNNKKGKGKERAWADQRPASACAHTPRPSPTIPSPPGPLAGLTQTASPNMGRYDCNAGGSNSPYIHNTNSESHNLNCRSTDTGTTTNYSSLRPPSNCPPRQTSSVHTARSGSPVLSLSSDVSSYSHVTASEDTDTESTKNGDTHSASDIEIGSMHSSSSVDSEELRRFYNDVWNVGPFLASGS